MADLTPKTINELPSASAVGLDDLFAISSGGTSKKVPGSAVVNTSGSGYCKMPDGTLTQWGVLYNQTVDVSSQLPNGMYYGTFYIDFPIAFKDGNYFAECTFRYSTGMGNPCGMAIGTHTASRGWFYLQDSTPRSGSDGRIAWMAIGRWK